MAVLFVTAGRYEEPAVYPLKMRKRALTGAVNVLDSLGDYKCQVLYITHQVISA